MNLFTKIINGYNGKFKTIYNICDGALIIASWKIVRRMIAPYPNPNPKPGENMLKAIFRGGNFPGRNFPVTFYQLSSNIVHG